jgi:hypothetical protein
LIHKATRPQLLCVLRRDTLFLCHFGFINYIMKISANQYHLEVWGLKFSLAINFFGCFKINLILLNKSWIGVRYEKNPIIEPLVFMHIYDTYICTYKYVCMCICIRSVSLMNCIMIIAIIQYIPWTIHHTRGVIFFSHEISVTL